MEEVDKRLLPYSLKLVEWEGTKRKARAICLKCGKIVETSQGRNFYTPRPSDQKPISSCRCCQTSPHMTKSDFQKRVFEVNKVEVLDFNGVSKPCVVRCLKCGKVFRVDFPFQLYKINSSGEPSRKCECSHQKGSGIEEKVAIYLINKYGTNNVERQFKSKSLTGVNGGLLSYDFRVGSFLIEVNGEQHYKPVEYFGGIEKFKAQIEHDRKKKIWADENGFKLIVIPYNEINNIENYI